MYLRDDQADIRLTVTAGDGSTVHYGDGNSWCTYSGAELEAKGSKTRPGGMGKQKAQGGPAERSDCTITIQNSDTMLSQHGDLESRIGKGNASLLVTFLDDEGVSLAGAHQFQVTGKLQKASLPAANFDSANVGMYTVVVSCDEIAVVS